MSPICLFPFLRRIHISTRILCTYIAALVAIIVISMLVSKCHQDTAITAVTRIPVAQQIVVSRFNDSMMLAAQETQIAETQEQLHIMQSLLQKELTNKLKISTVIASVEYRDSIVYRDIPNTTDYFSNNPDSTFPLHFKHLGKYLSAYYSVHSKDSAVIDSLSIVNKQHIIIGKSGRWYQHKQISIGIVNENPFIKIDSMNSVVYKPKPQMEFSIGPIILINQRSASAGIALTVKKGIFSFSAGYKFF